MADGRTARPGHVTPGARPLRRLRPFHRRVPTPPPSHTAHAHTRARAPRPPLPFYTLLSRSSLLPTLPPPPPRRAARAFQGNRKWRAGEGRAGGGTIENKERRFGAAAREACPRLGPALPRIPGVPRCSSSAAAAASGPGGGVWFVLLHRGGVARAALGVGGSGPGGLRGAVATRVRWGPRSSARRPRPLRVTLTFRRGAGR